MYRIPVVMHIIHNGEPIGEGYNFTDSHIKQQIEILNNDFRRRNADAIHTPEVFKIVAADTYIEFELAKVDPFGAPTTGIVRKDGSSLTHLDSIKTFSYWPAEDYMNVWVIDYGPRSYPLLGFAQFPMSNPPGMETKERSRLTDGHCN